MVRRNGPVVKSVESVPRLEGSLWGGERFVEEYRHVVTIICFSNSYLTYNTAVRVNVRYVLN